MGYSALFILCGSLTVIIGFCVWYFTARHYRKRDVGNLVIHTSRPEDDMFSLEFKENPKVIFESDHKYVLLWVKEV